MSFSHQENFEDISEKKGEPIPLDSKEVDLEAPSDAKEELIPGSAPAKRSTWNITNRIARVREAKRLYQEQKNSHCKKLVMGASGLGVLISLCVLLGRMATASSRKKGLYDTYHNMTDQYHTELVPNTSLTCDDYDYLGHDYEYGNQFHDPCSYLDNEGLPQLCLDLLVSLCDTKDSMQSSVSAQGFMYLMVCLFFLAMPGCAILSNELYTNFFSRRSVTHRDDQLGLDIKGETPHQALSIITSTENQLTGLKKSIETFLMPSHAKKPDLSSTLHPFFNSPMYDKNLLPEIFDFLENRPK